MKLRLSYLLLFTLLIVSCGREITPVPAGQDGDGICFGVKRESLVKSSNPDLPTEQDYLISDGNIIGVFATWKSENDVPTDVFSKLPVVCTDNGEEASPRYTWDYSPRKYWRQGGQYYFRAVFPYSVNTQFGTDGTRIVTSYSMLADNYDLMVAGAYRDLRTQDDTSPVNFQFKHACAAVRVLFKKGTEDPNRYYLLNSFEMKHLRSVGILAYEGDELSVNSWRSAEFRSSSLFKWSASTEEEQISVPAQYDDFKTITDSDWVQWHYVIPQTLSDADGLHPSVRFSVNVKQYEDDGVTLAYESLSPVYTTLELPLTYEDSNGFHDVTWEPGKTYTYYIQIQPGHASITVEVTEWDRYYVYVDDVIFN